LRGELIRDDAGLPETANRAGARLKIAGIPHDEAYFREQIAPHSASD
jgi:hypothetical protein